MIMNDIQTHESISSIAQPVISKDAGTALSWTPSAGECLKDGVRYVWYVGARTQGTDYRLQTT